MQRANDMLRHVLCAAGAIVLVPSVFSLTLVLTITSAVIACLVPYPLV